MDSLQNIIRTSKKINTTTIQIISVKYKIKEDFQTLYEVSISLVYCLSDKGLLFELPIPGGASWEGYRSVEKQNLPEEAYHWRQALRVYVLAAHPLCSL